MRATLLTLLSLVCLSSFGADSETIRFNGQEADSLSLDLVKQITRYRTEYRDSTCTRQIPYQTEECGFETRYRQECRWQPGRNECRTEYDTQCRTVTRYRRECTRSNPQRVCRNTEPRQICRNGVCRTEPSRRICNTKPGQETCRQVPYQDRQCTREPRQVCSRIPGRNVCDQVPYQDYVCRTVTRYRSETYACKEPVSIPFQVQRDVKANVEVSYDDTTNVARAKLDFTLLQNGEVSLQIKDRSDEPTYITVDKRSSTANNDDNLETEASFDVRFLSKEEVAAPIAKGIQSVGITKNTLFFSLGRITNPSNVEITAVIKRNRLIGSDKVLLNKIFSASNLKLTNTDSGTKVTINLGDYGVELKKRKYEIFLTAEVKLDSRIVNRNREEFKVSRSVELRID